VRLNINESDPDILDLCFYLSEDCNETSVDTCHVFVNGEPCDCPFFRGLNDSLYVVFEWDPATIELLIDIIDMFPHFRTLAFNHNSLPHLAKTAHAHARTHSIRATAHTPQIAHAGSSSTISLGSPSLATGAVLATAAPMTAVTTRSARPATTPSVSH